MLKITPFFLFLSLLFCQCQQQQEASYDDVLAETQHDGPRFGQEYPLVRGDQVTLFGGEAPRKLHVTLMKLEDSRCPAGKTCVWYGNATVTLSASNSQGKNEQIELCIGQCPGSEFRETHTTTAQVGETNYRFTLKAVVPYPGTEKRGEQKRALLVVEKI